MSSTSLISVLLLSLLPHASAFQKSQCNTNIQALLANNTLSPTSPIFYRSLNGTPFSQTDNIILTVPGCESTCGTGTSFYDDVGPRLSTWLIPILLLLGNMHLARLGSEKYAGMLHVIGDPIDSMWSLLTTAESWSRSLEVAERMTPKQPWESSETYQRRLVDIATIYTSISELASSSDRNDPPYFARIFSSILGSRKPSMSTEAFYHLVKETANELSDSRAAGLRRAGIAVFAYFYQVIAGFVDVIGGESSSPPGGRIGTSMFISWLIPTVLVSNALGGFSSRRTALRILERFVKTVQGEEVEDVGVFSADKSSSMLSACGSRSRGGRGRKGSGSKMISTTTDFYASQRWSGSIYCYRAQKLLFRGGKRDTNPLTLFILSLLPVVISTSTSIALIWVTPTVGFDCRSLMMLVISLLWLLSALFTFLTYLTGLANGVYHYRLTLIKDAMIGIPVLSMIVLSSCGIFNSCFCWSAIFSLRSGAYVVLDDHDEREINAQTYYPGLVAACLGLQLVVFLVMMWVGRRGGVLFRRDEDKKQEDWLETHGRRGYRQGSGSEEVGGRGAGISGGRVSEGRRLLPRDE